MIPSGLNILVNIVFSSSPILCWPLWPNFFCCFLNITYILLFPFLVDLFMVILYLYSFGSWVKVIYSHMKILSKGPQMWEKMRCLSFYVLLLPTFFSSFIHGHEIFQTLFVYRGIAFLCAYVLHFHYTFINSWAFWLFLFPHYCV